MKLSTRHIEVGDYLSKIFPTLSVRFISVNDSFDTANSLIETSTAELEIVLKNLRNDFFSRELSIKVRQGKISSIKQGHYQGCTGFFGYKKDGDNKHSLILDKDAANIVKLIFDYAIKGYSITNIAQMLNEEHIPTPMLYKQQHMNFSGNSILKDKNYWTQHTVSKILNEERYTGKLISCNRQTTRLDTKKNKSWALPKEQWIILSDAIEPIISEEVFFQLKNSRRHVVASNGNIKEENILRGKVKCGGCGHLLYRKKNKSGQYYYYCCLAKVVKNNQCVKDTLQQNFILDTLVQVIQKQATLSNMLEERINLENQKLAGNGFQEKSFEFKLQNIAMKKETLQQQRIRYYEQLQNGTITKETFKELNFKLKNRVTNLTQEEKNFPKHTEILENYQFLLNFKQQRGLVNLTREIIDKFVDTVVIFENYEIQIRLKYQDEMKDLREDSEIFF